MNTPRWDLFISHASEDKEGFVRPLALELRSHGLRVWYDEFSLTIGDSLSRSIDAGLANSLFGVVVLSPRFFEKEWTRRELDGLVAREIGSGKVVLPVWHGVGHADVSRHSPTLADKVALNSTLGVIPIANSIARLVQPMPVRTLEIATDTLNRLRHELMAPVDGILAHLEWLDRFVLSELDPGGALSHKMRLKLEDIRENGKLIEMVVKTMAPFREEPQLDLRLISLCANMSETPPVVQFKQQTGRRKPSVHGIPSIRTRTYRLAS